MEQLLEYSLDLIEVEGKGDFACPCCGILISPDDETENVYTVLEAKVSNNVLENLMIRCNTCGIKIVLNGFPLLMIE
jgi:DNA-directed RNA polymerase subunit RPC12/RpoP